MNKLLLTTILISLSMMCFGQESKSIAMSNYFFISSGNWNDGSHWNTGEVPPEGSDVFIAADAVIPAGYTAIANQISLLGGSITVADGGQLKHNTQGLVVTMEKSIAAFNEVNNWSNYYLLAFPFSEDVAVPSTMTANEDNDFYTFDSNYPNAEWRNNKQHVITTVGGTIGYLYANPEDIELSLTGSTYQSYDEASITVEVTYSEGSNNTFNGWALLGNPYTCNAYVYAFENGSCVPKEFMVYDADGELVRCLCSSVAPMQGFFVKVEETTTICIKTTSPYVDLGLPSGTLWAACNVGAVTPEDYGDYFAWGETQPKDFYDWSTYQYCNGSYNTLTKYCSGASFGYNGFSDTLTVLLPEDDAATANWGNDWRMPTKEEWQELYNNTTHVWTTQNGVNGRLFTSENGNSLFLPAGSIYSNGSLGSTGSGSYYWSSSLSIESPNLSWQYSFYSNGCNSYEFARFFGLSVRPVRSGLQSTSYIIDATANPAEAGEISGSGTYQEGDECTLTAIANDGYTFSNWKENDSIVSTDANYTFTVNADRILVANFTYNGGVVVTTSEPMDITTNSATCGGNVISVDGNYVSVLKGICWSTHSNPTFNDSYVEVGSGLGSFTASMTGLALGTIYYVRAFAVTSDGTFYGNQMTFATRDGIPTLTTIEVTDITGATATCGGDITDDGGLEVIARGVCWNIAPNPTIADSHCNDGEGIGIFSSSITGLNVSTNYYVRAYATTSAGTAYGDQKIFTTRDGIPTLTTADVTGISFFSAIGGGIITDDGGLEITDYGICWSTSSNPTILDSYSYDCGFDENFSFTCEILNLNSNTTYFVRAYASNSNTTVYGNEVSFTTSQGAINGLFTINGNGDQVYFSQGNLQYQASTNTWKFADNQYDYVGGANSNISSTYDGWIDLFGWGTSGWNSGNTYYHPWDSNNSAGSLYGPPGSYNLTGTYANADWGVYNPISNGGNQTNQWRTLTEDEWAYVFNTRNTVSGIRYAKANVNNLNGVILLPDDWNTITYSLSNTNSKGASFSSNTITAARWTTLENAGAVFLPAAANRYGASVYEVGSDGNYWSASKYYGSDAYIMHFGDSYLSTYLSPRYFGLSVRLVHDAE